VELRLPTKPLSQRLSRFRKHIPGYAESLELPLNPAEKQPSSRVRVVIGMTNAAAVGCHPTRQFADQARPIGADHLKDDRGVTHNNALKNKILPRRRGWLKSQANFQSPC
jgi:hypothetical protein